MFGVTMKTAIVLLVCVTALSFPVDDIKEPHNLLKKVLAASSEKVDASYDEKSEQLAITNQVENVEVQTLGNVSTDLPKNLNDVTTETILDESNTSTEETAEVAPVNESSLNYSEISGLEETIVNAEVGNIVFDVKIKDAKLKPSVIATSLDESEISTKKEQAADNKETLLSINEEAIPNSDVKPDEYTGENVNNDYQIVELDSERNKFDIGTRTNEETVTESQVKFTDAQEKVPNVPETPIIFPNEINDLSDEPLDVSVSDQTTEIQTTNYRNENIEIPEPAMTDEKPTPDEYNVIIIEDVVNNNPVQETQESNVPDSDSSNEFLGELLEEIFELAPDYDLIPNINKNEFSNNETPQVFNNRDNTENVLPIENEVRKEDEILTSGINDGLDYLLPFPNTNENSENVQTIFIVENQNDNPQFDPISDLNDNFGILPNDPVLNMNDNSGMLPFGPFSNNQDSLPLESLPVENPDLLIFEPIAEVDVSNYPIDPISGENLSSLPFDPIIDESPVNIQFDPVEDENAADFPLEPIKENIENIPVQPSGYENLNPFMLEPIAVKDSENVLPNEVSNNVLSITPIAEEISNTQPMEPIAEENLNSFPIEIFVEENINSAPIDPIANENPNDLSIQPVAEESPDSFLFVPMVGEAPVIKPPQPIAVETIDVSPFDATNQDEDQDNVDLFYELMSNTKKGEHDKISEDDPNHDHFPTNYDNFATSESEQPENDKNSFDVTDDQITNPIQDDFQESISNVIQGSNYSPFGKISPNNNGKIQPIFSNEFGSAPDFDPFTFYPIGLRRTYQPRIRPTDKVQIKNGETQDTQIKYVPLDNSFFNENNYSPGNLFRNIMQSFEQMNTPNFNSDAVQGVTKYNYNTNPLIIILHLPKNNKPDTLTSYLDTNSQNKDKDLDVRTNIPVGSDNSKSGAPINIKITSKDLIPTKKSESKYNFQPSFRPTYQGYQHRVRPFSHRNSFGSHHISFPHNVNSQFSPFPYQQTPSRFYKDNSSRRNYHTYFPKKGFYSKKPVQFMHKYYH